MAKRIEYIDGAKAIAIIAVIIGHCGPWIQHIPYATRFIYSFHIPLFFILSGYFIKDLPLKKAAQKYGKRYLIPYLISILVGFIIVITIAALSQILDYNIINNYLLRAVYASGGNISIFLHDIPIIGPLWFLWGGWFSCIIYTIISNLSITKNSYTSKCLLFFFGAIISMFSERYINLPLSFQAGCFAALYIFAGHVIKKYDIITKFEDGHSIIIILALLLWILSIRTGFYNLGTCTTGTPLNFIMSFIAPIVILLICKKVDLKGGWVGASTLSIFCAHGIIHIAFYFAGNPYSLLHYNIIVNSFITIFGEISSAFIGALILQRAPLINQYFK